MRTRLPKPIDLFLAACALLLLPLAAPTAAVANLPSPTGSWAGDRCRGARSCAPIAGAAGVTAGAAAPIAGGIWTHLQPATAPSARYSHAVSSAGGDQALLFGGLDGSLRGDTWVYDLRDNTWTERAPAASPSARREHAMASLGGDKVLLFGGGDADWVFGDTWVYDLGDNTWTPKTPPSAPSPREGHAMASLGGDQVLLFGGWDGSTRDDTWVYDLSANTWTQVAPASAPPPRDFHAMAAAGAGRVLLFGGSNACFGDTWLYDLGANTWTEMAPAAAPSGRKSHAMVYLGADQVLLFGGMDAGYIRRGDTWVYDLSDNEWTDWAPAVAPSVRNDHAIASLGTDQVLLFGGMDGDYDGETWLAAGFLFLPTTNLYLPLVTGDY